MCHHKPEEGLCLANCPRLKPPRLVIFVHGHDRDRIDGGNGDWDSDIESRVEDVGWDGERRCSG